MRFFSAVLASSGEVMMKFDRRSGLVCKSLLGMTPEARDLNGVCALGVMGDAALQNNIA